MSNAGLVGCGILNNAPHETGLSRADDCVPDNPRGCIRTETSEILRDAHWPAHGRARTAHHFWRRRHGEPRHHVPLQTLGIYSFRMRGIAHYERANKAARLTLGGTVRLVRESNNPHDPNAVAIYAEDGTSPLGYVNKQNAKRIAARMDAGETPVAINAGGSPWVLVTTPEVLAHYAAGAEPGVRRIGSMAPPPQKAEAPTRTLRTRSGFRATCRAEGGALRHWAARQVAHHAATQAQLRTAQARQTHGWNHSGTTTANFNAEGRIPLSRTALLTCVFDTFVTSGWRDLNPRPLDPQAA